MSGGPVITGTPLLTDEEISVAGALPITFYGKTSASATPLTSAAIEAAPDDTAALTAGANYLPALNLQTTPGTWYYNYFAKNASGSSAVQTETYVIEAPASVSHVLGPLGASSGLTYGFTANTIFNLTTSKSAGYWLGGYAYFDGTNWTGDIMSVADSAATTGFMAMSGNFTGWRALGGTFNQTTALANPSVAGWYFVTAYQVIKEAGDPAPRHTMDFWRNGTQATPYSSSVEVPAGFINMNQFGFGYRADNTPDQYNNFEYCGLCWGTGNPALMHAWVFNSGTLRDVRNYNFAGDANGCTLGGFWRLSQDTPPAFNVTDPVLDDTIGTIDTPVQVGTMQWVAQAAPIGA